MKLDRSENQPEPSTQTVKTLLEAASAALRSYQYGNAAPDLARRVADEIQRKTGWGY